MSTLTNSAMSNDGIVEKKMAGPYVLQAYTNVFSTIKLWWKSQKEPVRSDLDDLIQHAEKILEDKHQQQADLIDKGAMDVDSFDYRGAIIDRGSFDAIHASIVNLRLNLDRLPKGSSKFDESVTSLATLLNTTRRIGRPWGDVTTPTTTTQLVQLLVSEKNTDARPLVEESLLALSDRNAAEIQEVQKMFECINTMITSTDLEAYKVAATVLEDLDKLIQMKNQRASVPLTKYAVPTWLVVQSISQKQSGKSAQKLNCYFHAIGAPLKVKDYDTLNIRERRQLFELALVGSSNRKSSFEDILQAKIKSLAGHYEPEEADTEQTEQDPSNTISNDDQNYIASSTEQGTGAPDLPIDDSGETILYQIGRDEFPKGSETVAWGQVRSSKFYINRIGPSGACIYREQDMPVVSHDPAVNEKWDNPPADLCITNPKNRLGELTTGNNKFKYTKRHIVGIFGVSFDEDKRPFEDVEPYEYLNQARYDSWNKRNPNEKKRFIGCHVRVGWEISPGQIVKTWELRGALRASARWKQKLADKAIYEAAKTAQERYEKHVTGKSTVSSRENTPADAVSYAIQGRQESLGPSVLTQKKTPRNESPSLFIPPRSPQTPGPGGIDLAELEHNFWKDWLEDYEVNKKTQLPRKVRMEAMEEWAIFLKNLDRE